MKALVFSLLLLSSLPSLAGKHAPLPDEITTAKTVYLVNNTGEQKVVDIAYDQFSKWGRFAVVTKKDAADLIVVFGSHDSVTRAQRHYDETRMDVFIRGQEDSAYEATRTVTPFGNATKDCVGDFRHRLEAK